MNEDNQNDDDKIVLDGTFKCPECGFREKHLASCSHRQYQDMPTLSGGQPWPCENLNKRPPRIMSRIIINIIVYFNHNYFNLRLIRFMTCRL